jgi:protein-disulfide isomerase
MGYRLAQKFDVTGTPTVLINGWRFGRPPTDSILLAAIDTLLAGGEAFPGLTLR